MSKFALTQGASGLALGGAAAVGAVVVGLYASGTLFPSQDGMPAPETAVEQAIQANPVMTTQAPAAQMEDSGEADVVVPEADPEEGVAEAVVPEAEQADPEVEQRAADTPADQSDGSTPDKEVADAASPEAPAPVALPENPETPNLQALPDLTAPAFDVVRVAPDGQTLVAGSAPGARDVRVLVDGQDVGVASVDGAGNFVAFLDLPSSTTARIVSLVSDGEDGETESVDQVILAPSVPSQEPALAAPVETAREFALPTVVSVSPQDDDALAADTAQEGGQTDVASEIATLAETAEASTVEDQSSEKDVAETAEAVETAPEVNATLDPAVTAPETPLSPAPAAQQEVQTDLSAARAAVETPTVFLSTRDGVDVLQSPGAAPQALDQIALDAITYEGVSTVALTGRGRTDEFVRIYIDNQPILTTEIEPDGGWRARLPNIESGTYTLRVDGVDADGAVTSRVESPFRREDPDRLAEAIDQDGLTSTVQVVTVQPGNTLWAIARDRYGEGPAYVKVFEANRDRIRDPDLIYPGQVFSIPN